MTYINTSRLLRIVDSTVHVNDLDTRHPMSRSALSNSITMHHTGPRRLLGFIPRSGTLHPLKHPVETSSGRRTGLVITNRCGTGARGTFASPSHGLRLHHPLDEVGPSGGGWVRGYHFGFVRFYN